MGGPGNYLKAMQILEYLARRGEGVGLSEICRQTGLAKTTSHRLLLALESSGYVVRDGSGRYTLGSRLLELAECYVKRRDLREVARPAMLRLWELSRETVHLVRFEETCGVYLDKIDTPHAVGLMSRIGGTLPLYCTGAGKAILAYLDEYRVKSIVQRVGLERKTPKTVPNYAALRAELNVIRARGYAIDNEEYRTGVVCIGAPIFDYAGQPIAALSISAPAARMSAEQAEEYAPDLLAGCLSVSVKVGYRVDERIAGWQVSPEGRHFLAPLAAPGSGADGRGRH